MTIDRAAIGRFYEEGTGKRAGMLHFRYTICDDGPMNVDPSRYARISVTHRWGSRKRESLLVRESYDLITYDVYFRTKECVSNIPNTSSVPADTPHATRYPCYGIVVRVRDPAGLWSNPAKRVLRRCMPGGP